jgi:CTP synthase (UTP-ammonia lyase)
MRYDRTITAWGDIFDKNEKPIPCTKEMKVALMTKVPEFIEAYTNGMKALKDAEEARVKEQEKN